jgi:hypothetical protein
VVSSLCVSPILSVNELTDFCETEYEHCAIGAKFWALLLNLMQEEIVVERKRHILMREVGFKICALETPTSARNPSYPTSIVAQLVGYKENANR